MEITFNKSNLRKWANSDKKGRKKLGDIFEPYKRRLDQLRAAESLEDLRFAPGNFHELRANRKGKWACSLSKNYRLIFTPQEESIPENDDGQYIWSAIKSVIILAIDDYH